MTSATKSSRLGITIDLDQLRELMRQFIDEHVQDSSLAIKYEWRFSTFLAWLDKRQKEKENERVLMFRVEKEKTIQ
jgi:2-phosphoglycerate kinase